MIKAPEAIDKMRVASRLAAQVLDMLTPHVVPGVSTAELDQLCHDYIVNTQQAVPASLNYRGFPGSVCTSVNQVICHGIPNKRQRLKSGDIINVDVTVKKAGYIGDTSKMFLVGRMQAHAKRLVRVTQECLYRGIAQVRPGARLGDIGYAIEQHAHANHYTVVQEFCGHGIGQQMHQAPNVPHFGKPHTGLMLKAGMTFTIEPMLNQGSRHISMSHDGWTVSTKDRRLSAQWEHTLLVTEDGYEILTLREEEKVPFPESMAMAVPSALDES